MSKSLRFEWSFFTLHFISDLTMWILMVHILPHSLGKPHPKKPCIFGHCPNCDLTPPIAQIRALCGTMFLPKMRKFSKQQFWLWEWIFWQWLRSKMILRWYSDWNQGKYWRNMMKIRWLSNGLYSLKNCHKQFGQAFRPLPLLDNSLGGAPLTKGQHLWHQQLELESLGRSFQKIYNIL